MKSSTAFVSGATRAFLTVLFILSLSACSGGSSGGDDTDDADGVDASPASESFSNGGLSLSAESVESDDTKTTTVLDADGATALTMTTTVDGITLTFADSTGSVEIPFAETLSGLPNNFASNRLATFIAAEIAIDADASLAPDSPGCDMFPDTQCTLGCCAQHDECYQLNNCGASSWLPFVGSDECDNCNTIAANCIVYACSTGENSAALTGSDACYDNRCREFYTCDDPASCECSPCTEAPSNCGDGSCNVDEDEDNCPADCLFGDGVNTCCATTGNCPSETATTCPGDCCCCGLGEVCGSDSLCVGSASESAPFLSIDDIPLEHRKTGVERYPLPDGN